jgi:hypothetical protein
LILYFHLLSKVQPPHIISLAGTTVSKWTLLPVFEFRPCSRQRKWTFLVTPYPRLARQDAQFFSRLMRCQNGSGVSPTSGFFMAIGLSQARLMRHSIVGCTCITR